MSILNVPLCTESAGNTGKPSCALRFGKNRGIILTKSTFYVPASDLADNDTFKAALQEATLATGSGRIWPIFRFEAVTDNSQEPQVQTSGYGEPSLASEGNYSWMFELADGSECYNYNLRKFNKQPNAYRAFFVDDNNNLKGVSDSDGNLWGFKLSILNFDPMKINDGSNAAKYMVRIAPASVTDWNDRFGIVPCTFDVETEVLGLLDVELVQLAVAAGTATIGLRLKCGKIDLYDDLSTLMASAALWKATDSTGATVTISDAGANATLKGWDVDTATTGAVTFTLASPATLAAAHIGEYPSNGYEGGTLTVTMPT